MKAGDKVVCVNSIPPNNGWNYVVTPALVEGVVYVVSGFSNFPWTSDDGLLLVGVRAECDGLEVGFNPDRFRKLDEMKAEAKNRKQLHERHVVSAAS